MLYNPQLETFLCVVESGSFSKAAEKLFITAPAVIKQINSLESSLNLQLFDRTHRGLIVTEEGKSIYKDEFVTAGGVDLREVDFKNMESKLLPNFYICGEVLNIDAITGGFNFQACWSEAWLISQKLNTNS